MTYVRTILCVVGIIIATVRSLDEEEPEVSILLLAIALLLFALLLEDKS